MKEDRPREEGGMCMIWAHASGDLLHDLGYDVEVTMLDSDSLPGNRTGRSKNWGWKGNALDVVALEQQPQLQHEQLFKGQALPSSLRLLLALRLVPAPHRLQVTSLLIPLCFSLCWRAVKIGMTAPQITNPSFGPWAGNSMIEEKGFCHTLNSTTQAARTVYLEPGHEAVLLANMLRQNVHVIHGACCFEDGQSLGHQLGHVSLLQGCPAQKAELWAHV